MDAQAAARAWVDAWTRAWRALDAELLAPVYTTDAVHRSHPFREPGNPIVSGDRAAIEWWAVVNEKGEKVSLAGTSILRFADDGRVVEQSDYWGNADGRTPPWRGWGRQTGRDH